jgi:hypothetical protein
MRFIKKFEYISDEYKINDYILLDMEQVNLENTDIGPTAKYPDDEVAQIISIAITYKKDDYPFYIKFYTDNRFYVKREEIARHLTVEEIKEFEKKKTAYKYNL